MSEDFVFTEEEVAPFFPGDAKVAAATMNKLLKIKRCGGHKPVLKLMGSLVNAYGDPDMNEDAMVALVCECCGVRLFPTGVEVYNHDKHFGKLRPSRIPEKPA